MKKICFILLTLAIFGFNSCKKETGPEGPQGPQGPMGNANIKEFTFTNLPNTTYGWVDTLNGIDYISLDSMMVMVYLQDSLCGSNWYFAPGLGCSGMYMARVYTFPYNLSTAPDMAGLQVAFADPDGSFYSGSAIRLAKIRVIVAPASVFVSGKKECDYSNYEAVRSYLQLRD